MSDLDYSLLHEIQSNNASLVNVKKYIEQGAKINSITSSDGIYWSNFLSILMLACKKKSSYNNNLIIKLLLENGANVNVTLLHHNPNRYRQEHYKCCALAIVMEEILWYRNYNYKENFPEGSMEYYYRDTYHKYIEIYFSEDYQDSFDTIQLLLEYCADLDLVDINFFNFDSCNHVNHLNALFRYIKDRKSFVELINNVKSGDLEMVKQCIGQKNVVNCLGFHNMTALMYACKNGNFEMALTLISAGADINARDRDNKTVLNYAAEGGNTKIMELLIAQGAKA